MSNCNNCDTLLLKRDQQKFCSKSCATTFNNKARGRARHWCKFCASSFYPRSKTNVYCSKSCRDKDYMIKLEHLLENGRTRNPASVRRYVLNNNPYQCVGCGISEWNGAALTLEVDHVNGNRSNNHPNNLRLLCPNCHSQTPTFRSKNRNGSGAAN